MRRPKRKFMLITVIMVFSLAIAILAFAQQKPMAPASGAPTTGVGGPGAVQAPPGSLRGGALMPVDVYTPLAKGYDLAKEGNYVAAKYEFAQAAKLDKRNPFALNNLGVLEERDGKPNDALADMKDATLFAGQYHDKVAETCFIGGSCMAIKPARTLAATSEIAPLLQKNIAALEAKIKAEKIPPPPTSPPPMMPAPKTK